MIFSEAPIMHHDRNLFAFYWNPETTEFQYCLLLENEIQILLFYIKYYIYYYFSARNKLKGVINHFDEIRMVATFSLLDYMY